MWTFFSLPSMICKFTGQNISPWLTNSTEPESHICNNWGGSAGWWSRAPSLTRAWGGSVVVIKGVNSPWCALVCWHISIHRIGGITTLTSFCPLTCGIISPSIMSNSLWPQDCTLPGSSVHESLQVRVGTLFPGDLPDTGMNQCLLHCRQILYQLSYQGSTQRLLHMYIYSLCKYYILLYVCLYICIYIAYFTLSAKRKWPNYFPLRKNNELVLLPLIFFIIIILAMQSRTQCRSSCFQSEVLEWLLFAPS